MSTTLLPLNVVPKEIIKLAQSQQLISQLRNMNDKHLSEQTIEMISNYLGSCLNEAEEWKFVFDEIRHMMKIRDPLLFATFFQKMKEYYLKISDQKFLEQIQANYEILFEEYQETIKERQDQNIIGFDVTMFLYLLKKKEHDAEMRKITGYMTMSIMDAIREDNAVALMNLLDHEQILSNPSNSKQISEKQEVILCSCALHAAISCFKTLIMSGFQITNNVEKSACASGNFEIVNYLVRHQCSFRDCLQVAAYYRRDSIIMWLLQYRAPTTKELMETINMKAGEGLYIPAACFLADVYNLALSYQSKAITAALIDDVKEKYSVTDNMIQHESLEKNSIKMINQLTTPLLVSARSHEKQCIAFNDFNQI